MLLCDVDTSAGAVTHTPHPMRRRREHLEDLKRTGMDTVEDNLLRRELQSSAGSTVAETSGINDTIASACINALSKSSNVSNPAGMGACYNILEWDNSTAAFQADLRFYQMAQPSGDFAQISLNDITIGLGYPSSTQFNTLVKRKKRDLETRQSSMDEVQQYSLFGTIQKSFDLSKLNR